MQTYTAAPLDPFYQRTMERPTETERPNERDPQVEKWVDHLLADLAADDLAMAMLDLTQLQSLARLHRTEAAEPGPARPATRYFSPFAPKETKAQHSYTTVIYSDDGEVAIDLCAGPDEDGRCPRTLTPSGCVQCAGMWLGSAGWKFKAATDAAACPLTMLGLA